MWNILIIGLLVYIVYVSFGLYKSKTLQAFYSFFIHCFLKPIGKDIEGQQGALESFYRGQSDVYDITRSRLLKGRTTLLALAAAEMTIRRRDKESKFIWIDVSWL